MYQSFPSRGVSRSLIHRHTDILFAGRCIHALWDAARVVRSAGKWRFHVVHRAILHRDCAMQRKRAGNCGDCRRPINVACTTSQVQEHHHSQQHREVHRRVLDLRDRCRSLASDLRENSGRPIARVRKDLESILFGFFSFDLSFNRILRINLWTL